MNVNSKVLECNWIVLFLVRNSERHLKFLIEPSSIAMAWVQYFAWVTLKGQWVGMEFLFENNITDPELFTRIIISNNRKLILFCKFYETRTWFILHQKPHFPIHMEQSLRDDNWISFALQTVKQSMWVTFQATGKTRATIWDISNDETRNQIGTRIKALWRAPLVTKPLHLGVQAS